MLVGFTLVLVVFFALCACSRLALAVMLRVHLLLGRAVTLGIVISFVG